jgi:thiamine pyrophosphate-dependent acetolactate synthase large subunit-like protein
VTNPQRTQPETVLNRRAVVATLLEGHDDLLVVPGLGSATWDCAAAGDNPLHFSLWGAMGNATVIGLGLALAQPERRVLVLTGDGDMLMGLGSLATIATQAPRNFAIVVLDNERHGETGMQPTHTAHATDLAGVAESCGFAATRVVADEAGLAAAMPLVHEIPGPTFCVIKVKAERLPRALPPRDGAYLKDRFRAALLGKAAVL